MELLFRYYYIWFFIILAVVKGVIEAVLKKRTAANKHGYSQKLSKYFMLTGTITPVIICVEALFPVIRLPYYLCVVFLMLSVIIWSLRVLAVTTLGKEYSVDVLTGDSHKLMQKGIYRYVRHPIYVIYAFENIFYPLAASGVISCVVLLVLVIPSIVLRIKVEEKELVKKHGSAYLDYRKRTII